MPRFFFHLRSDRKSLIDCEGVAVADAEAARRLALLTLRDFVQPSTGAVDPEWRTWMIQIADERGRCLVTVPFADVERLVVAEPAGDDNTSAPSHLVYLDIERARRQFRAVENEVRQRIHDIAKLTHRNRQEASDLRRMLVETHEVRRRTQELLTRSREQPPAGDWCWPPATAGQR
jgi:uncharacterized protein DUF6894